MKFNVFYLLCIFTLAYCQNRLAFRFCVYPSDHLKCADLNRGGSSVQCVEVQDSVDCALKIKNNEADFGAFFAEQSFLVSLFIDEETVVVGDLRAQRQDFRNNSFQAVVLVKNDYNGGIEGLRGKKYCHPGFDYHELWTPRMLKDLEYLVLKGKDIKCSDNGGRTCIENEIDELSKYFGDSCRPGTWVQEDATLDKELKKRYSKLCKLCDSVESCSYNNKDLPDNAIQCMKEKNGDLAYTSLQTVLSKIPDNEWLNYKLLCIDGANVPVGRNIPDHCSWRNQPWPLILARREKANGLRNGLKQWILPELLASSGPEPYASGSHETWMETFQDILTSDRANRLKIYYNNNSPQEFLKKNDQKLNLENKHVHDKMKWCTVSEEENQKCKWLGLASDIAGIVPEMECVQAQNVYDCLNKIKDEQADLISIDSRLGYLARKNNLQNLLYNDKSDKDISSIVAVLPESSNIKTFADLKGKKACFPEYQGLAWISFVETARKHKVLENSCDYGKSVSEFFSKLCAPGAKDTYHKRTDGTNVYSICALCNDNCQAAESNKYYKDAGALQCLKENNADVAFFKMQALNSTALRGYKIMCKDGSINAYDQIPDINKCSFYSIVDSEVVARHGDPKQADYKLALLHMEQLFGTSFKNEKTMEMFKPFNGFSNLIFKDTVLGFEDDSSSNDYVQNYKKLFKNIDESAQKIRFVVNMELVSIRFRDAMENTNARINLMKVNVVEQLEVASQCIHVDHMCDGIEHCAYGSDENKSTCEELPCPEKTFRCKHGGCVHLDARCNGISDCIDGSDESEMLCKNLQCKGASCRKLRNKIHCPAIDISRIDAICQSAVGVVPCDNPVPAGTTVEYECKPHFVAVDDKHGHNRRASCQLDGIWNRKLLQCEPKCGDIGPEAVALVVNGWDTGNKIYPWHATMYVEEEGKWEFWCGGTLISEKAVLTAGHCTWKILAKNIKVAFGKYYTDFHKRQHITQIRNIQRVITQPLYQDRTGNYGSDLAVLVLSDPVKLSSEIHPACIDWNLRDTIYHFKNNSIGLAVGMGITENDTFSETLKGVYLPVVSNEKCVEDQEQDFKKYITYTVFCAGWKNGTAVCNGDSGGGLLFPKISDKSKWILQGVVSVSPRKKGTSFCNPQFYTVFTKISLYLNWLKETLRSIHHQYYG
ncbi:Transferrin 3 [Carabus blaptoides fortunei]